MEKKEILDHVEKQLWSFLSAEVFGVSGMLSNLHTMMIVYCLSMSDRAVCTYFEWHMQNNIYNQDVFMLTYPIKKWCICVSKEFRNFLGQTTKEGQSR